MSCWRCPEVKASNTVFACILNDVKKAAAAERSHSVVSNPRQKNELVYDFVIMRTTINQVMHQSKIITSMDVTFCVGDTSLYQLQLLPL